MLWKQATAVAFEGPPYCSLEISKLFDVQILNQRAFVAEVTSKAILLRTIEEQQ